MKTNVNSVKANELAVVVNASAEATTNEAPSNVHEGAQMMEGVIVCTPQAWKNFAAGHRYRLHGEGTTFACTAKHTGCGSGKKTLYSGEMTFADGHKEAIDGLDIERLKALCRVTAKAAYTRRSGRTPLQTAEASAQTLGEYLEKNGVQLSREAKEAFEAFRQALTEARKAEDKRREEEAAAKAAAEKKEKARARVASLAGGLDKASIEALIAELQAQL